MHFKHLPIYFSSRSLWLLLLATGLGACSKKADSPAPQPKPVVSFGVQFVSNGPGSWSRNYTEAECTALPWHDFGSQNILLSFQANPTSGDECQVEVMGVSKSELVPGVVGTYDGDGLFKVELSYRPKNFQCYVPATAYTNLHGTPYTFTITAYDAATKRASGSFDLNLGGQANPALCPQQGSGQVRAQGTFRDVVLPY